jgi:single-stranded-DNA-specific exonuclease
MAKYQRPVLLLNKTEDGWEGSGRGYDKSKFDNFREFLKESGLVMYAEGHANAFGAGITDNNFIDFIKYSNEELAEFDFTPCYKVDFIFNGGDFKGKDIIEIANLKSLWGQGVEEPYIVIEHINVYKDNLQLMSKDKSPTLKITLPNGTSLIKFKSSNEEFEKLYSELGCVTINVVGRCEQNIWNGIVNPQITIEDYEIVGEQKYCF